MLTRRQLFRTTGAGAFGLAVVSTVTACSGSTSGSATPSSGGDAGSSTGSAPGDAQSLAWHRVSLSFVSAYLLVRGGEVAVVDTGTTGSGSAITGGLTAAGLSWDAVRHVVLTHKHPDHAGGLASVEPLATRATFSAGRADVDGIASAASLRALDDGADVLGLQVVGTPGHTIGHISVFDPGTGVLVAGDALRTTDGLQSSDPQFTADPAKAAASVKRLAGLDIRVILPGHGDPLTSGAAQALKALAATL